jgi:hypothetical protein
MATEAAPIAAAGQVFIQLSLCVVEFVKGSTTQVELALRCPMLGHHRG